MTDMPNDDALMLHALADDELDAGTALALERRMKSDPPLAAEYRRIVALKQAVGRVERPVPSDDFQARIAALTTKPSAAPAASRSFAFDWRAMAASFVLVAALSSASTYWVTASRETTSIEDAVLSGHRRSLLAASPIDVASSDRHTVRPWFDSKLGMAPPAVDLTEARFPLVGGRVEIVAGKPIPTLVYRHGPHLITLAAIPLPTGDAARTTPINSATGGYNTMHWEQAGFDYWAVSDLDAAELASFVEALRSK